MSKCELKVDLDVNTMPVHRQLRWKRIAQGLTQDEMAELLGMGGNNRAQLSRYENGKAKLMERYMERVLEYLYGKQEGAEQS